MYENPGGVPSPLLPTHMHQTEVKTLTYKIRETKEKRYEWHL